MPIYEYRPTTKRNCDFCSRGFEIMQKINDPALSLCPECRAPVERRISAPNIARGDTSLDPANLEKHGFTQYKKAGKGVYEKTAGKGPNVIKDD